MRDAKEDLERFKNPKRRPTEKELGIRQIPFRLHRNDYEVMKRMLHEDAWKFQTMIQACVDAYIKRNPLMIKLLADWKEENSVPQDFRRHYSFSKRERRDLLDEIGDVDEED